MRDGNLHEWEEFEAPASAQETPPANAFKADPYASIRSAMAPEHASLLPEEVPLFLGRMPAALALHQYLNSSEMHQATLAALLGTGARRSVHIDESEVPIPVFLRLVSRLCREVAEQTEIESRGERESAEGHSLRSRYRKQFETARPGDTEGERFETFEIPLQESEFRPDRLPQAVRNEFSKTDSAAWRQAMLQAIASGARNTAALANLIFFMQHRDRVVKGVGQPIKSDEPAFAKLQAEWDLYETIANRHLNPSRPHSIFLPANPSSDYEKYIAKPTTGLITLMVNGRTSGRDQIEAFDSMRQTVESLGRGDSLFLANWQFMPTATPLTTPPSGQTWADLLKRKALDGVRIRVIISDLPPAAAVFQTNLKPLDDVIGALPASARDNWKYIFSPHPAHMTASHHQKVLVATKGQTVVAYCGGLDISVNRIPVPKNSFVWHDVHARLEGLIARDIEREFVLRWNREKDKTTAPIPLTWKELERLTPAALSRLDASPNKNKHKLQMLRTVSVGWDLGERRRTDIWQGYFRLIGSAIRFLFLENQYFHEPAMADAIVKQVEDQPDLIVIIVVSTVSDDKKSPITENMHALRHEFLSRLSRIPQDRLGIYTMKGSLVHSKLIMVDDRALSMGSANANPRDFFLDTQLNVMLDDADAVRNFRRHLWAHDLGVAESVVAAWTVPEFISQWNAVANANDVLNATSKPMPGEGILIFDRTKHAKDVGQRLPLLDIFSEQENEPSSENDTETPLALEAESQFPFAQTSEEVFDPLNPPNDIASALQAKDWARALGQAIQVGMRDENALTNLIFFGKHQELPLAPLDPKNPKFKQLSSEWMQILNGEVWTAIKAASENTTLVVSGEEVASNDRFFWGTSGKRLKKLVEDAAKEVGLNPGLLGNIIMAETQSPWLYLTSGKVSSYDIGTDDFFEGRAAIAARVPAFKKVKWDTKQTPAAHPNDAITPREVKTILFDSGPDALLATAVYAKFREIRLREIAKDMKQDFDALPIETRFALTRMAMAAGTAGVTPLLKDALAGRDILIRKAIPVVIYQTQRNGTVRTAQAMHLSEWIFGIKVLPSTQPAQKTGTSGKPQQPAPSQSQKQEAGKSSESSQPSELEDTPFPLLSREAEVEPEGQVGQFGTGTRKRVSNTEQIPFRWICSISATRRIQRPSHVERRGLAPAGTGLLISPCHVLTAAHVLKSVERDDRGSITEEQEAETVEVTPARDEDRRPYGKFNVKSWVLHPKWDPKKADPRTDYAVITLDMCAGNQKFTSLQGQPLGSWPLELPPTAVRAALIGGEVLTIGYPESKNKQMWCFSGRASTGSAQVDATLTRSRQTAADWVSRNSMFRLSADAEKGQSGSPVWATDHDKRYVVGVLVDAGSQSNLAITVNDDVIRQIQAWTGQQILTHELGHAFESLTEEAEFSSESEQTHRSWIGSPYIGHAEMLNSIQEHEDPPPRGLVLLDHMHISKTADLAVAGGFRVATTPTVLKPSDMNPGFIDGRDELITDRSPSGMQTCLDHTITSQFSRFLASKSATKANGRDRVRIGIVDLTGAKLAKPEFAGWGSTVAMYGASSPKMLAVYAAFQLRRDLRQMAEDQAIPTGKELAAFAIKTWKDKNLSSGLPDLVWLFDINHWSAQPNNLNFTPDARAAFAHISDNAAASLVIHGVGFPYIASVAWQSGLRHAFRGGLWLSRAYDGTVGWVNNPSMKAPAFMHNITGLSVATFFTLLAQGRLVDDGASAEIMTVLKLSPLGGGCKSCLFPSGITLEATKCGIFKPFMHDCILARHSGTRYTAAILTEIDATWHADGLCPTGGETGLYTDLCKAMDNLIQANNRPTKSACE